MSDKRLVFIVSGGRTGTKFFAVQLGRLLDDARAVHEPDALHMESGGLLKKIGQFGFRHMVVDRLRGKSGIRQLGEAFLCGEVSQAEAIRRMRRARVRYYASISEQAIIESYYAWYGLVPLLDGAFSNVRVLSVLRDPRDWVRSQMNWGTQYGGRDWAARLGFAKLSPARVGDREFEAQWGKMDRFARICWLWRTIYTALSNAASLPFVHTERYEDLFFGEARVPRLERTLEFLLDGACEIPPADSMALQDRIHGNVSYSFPHWRQWSRAQAQQLDRICGGLMNDFGYGTEPDWARLIGKGGR